MPIEKERDANLGGRKEDYSDWPVGTAADCLGSGRRDLTWLAAARRRPTRRDAQVAAKLGPAVAPPATVTFATARREVRRVRGESVMQ